MLKSDPVKTRKTIEEIFASPGGELFQKLLQRAIAKGPASGPARH